MEQIQALRVIRKGEVQHPSVCYGKEDEIMKRVYNFSAGPAVLPEEVLREIADEMLDYRAAQTEPVSKQNKDQETMNGRVSW